MKPRPLFRFALLGVAGYRTAMGSAATLLPLLWLLASPAAGRVGDFTYTTDDGKITITGYAGPGGAVSIPGTIIGLPVTQIGDTAFRYSGSITSVTIPNSVTIIGVLAFGGCAGLTDITIGNSVTTIGSGAFRNCTSLTSIMIPNSVTSIEGMPFWGGGAFESCTSLTRVTIGNGVTNLGFRAFRSCTSLTNVVIPNSVTSIGYQAFSDCESLTSVTIPNSVTTIGAWMFQSCTSLTGVYFRGNAPIEGSVFEGAEAVIVYYLPGTTGWGTTFAERPTALWVLPYPLILNSGLGFGAQTNGFGFIVSWATNSSVVVEASPDLANPIWTPVSTNTLTGGSSEFSDPEWTIHPTRFYRLVSAVP